MKSRKKFLQEAGVFLIFLILLFSNFLIMAYAKQDILSQIAQSNTPIYRSSLMSSAGYTIILEEDFTDGIMPPTDWKLTQNNPNETWYIDSSFPHSETYCTTVHRGNEDEGEIQDEWLITPSMDLSDYNTYGLTFWWYTNQYTAQEEDYIDLNVTISIDGEQTWESIWNEDALSDCFSWKWYNTNYGNHIDLSGYAGQTDVRIAFRYYSNTSEYAYAQEFSIDDIIIYGESDPFWCSPGGPYEIAWDWNNAYGIKFHGDTGDGDPPYLDWLWDFGDNYTNKMPYFPTHRYDSPGIYNVNLTVKDSKGHVSFAETTVEVKVTPPPEIEIKNIQGGLKISADLYNGGTLNVSYVNWQIIVQWGPFKMFETIIANDTIENLEFKSSEVIQSGYFIGFGRITIIIKAEPENALGDEQQRKAFKIGPFVFGVH